MRLICPNCSAQYEVDGSLIPEEGRDVQCSNCGNTWFELPEATAEIAAPVAPDLGVEDDPAPVEVSEDADEGDDWQNRFADVDEPTFERESEPARSEEEENWDWPDENSSKAGAAEPEPEVAVAESDASEPEIAEKESFASRSDEDSQSDEAEFEPEPEDIPETDEPQEDEPEEEFDETPVVAARPVRRPVDVAAMDLLKEEAQREIDQRRKDNPSTIETQSEFNLEDHRDRNTPSRALRARMARMKSEDDAPIEETKQEDYRAPRRDLLPDIEEINSSLKPGSSPEAAPTPEAEARNRRGFRVGFLSVVVIAAIMVLAYAYAPNIAAAVPAAEGPLLAYIDIANSARDVLDGFLASTSPSS
ncbi:MAG: zinc-ribbon domain-containing protein [Boseongicola sp.]|nr:zinc-ribbon domain-containing protein [Boseongicola sp.]MDD9977970.1 zinc-ribbon domain-containing protein [Boseongicola sp.]